MSRSAAALLIAASLWLAPALAVGADDAEGSSRTSDARGAEIHACAARSETGSGWMPDSCPARSQTASSQPLEAQRIPIFVPPNRGSPPTRIGGASRGGARPLSRT